MTGSEPFAAFMARALYDPRLGYYARNIRTVGARGDFSTAATLSPLLGQAVAAWLAEEARLQPQIRHIIEIGPGDGSLQATVRKAMSWWQRRRFQFHLVETSPVLRARQQERLGPKAQWHENMIEALRATQGQALIFHNEVLDAFPATLIQRHEGAWHEVHVRRDDAGHWREELKPLTLPATGFSALGDWSPPVRQRCELHASVKDWLEEWAPHWHEGAMLTVDYGDTFPALYHRRPAGTLRAYLLQQRLEGAAIYENPGRQDITADVNFTDYRTWARELGLEEAAYGSQADFITPRVRPPSANSTDAFFLHTDGAGGAFKHVIHRRLRR